MKANKVKAEDLGLKVAQNPLEAKWLDIKDRAEKGIENSIIEIEINKTLIKLAGNKILKIQTAPDEAD